MTPSTERSTPPVGRVLTVAGGALVLAFGALVWTSVLQTRRVAASLETIRSELRPRAEAAYEMEINLLEVSDAMFAFLAEGDTSRLRTFEAERRQLQDAVSTYASLDRSAVEEPSSRMLRALMSSFDSLSVALVQTARNADKAAALAGWRAGYGEMQSRIAAHLDTEIQPAAIARWHLEADRVLTLSQRQRTGHVYVAVLGTAIALIGG